MKKGSTKKGSSNTAKPKQKAKPATSTAARSSIGTTSSNMAKGKTVNEMSHDFKKLVVEELIRSGRTRVVTRKGRASMAIEHQKK